jgi:hypothetical protein
MAIAPFFMLRRRLAMTFINEGASDRLIRLVLSIASGYAAWITWPGTVSVVLVVIATIALVTGIVGFCPAYTLFGFSTKKTRIAH